MKYFRRASHKLKLTVRRPEDIIWCVYREISGKSQKSLITPIMKTITRITNTFKNKEKSVESFFQICVIKESQKYFYRTLFEKVFWETTA